MAGETHRYGKMEWVFYIIILPLLFTALLSGVILQLMGFDITGSISQKFKALTGHQTTATVKTASSNDPTKLLKDSQDKVKTLQKTNQQLQDDLTAKKEQIDSLQKQVDSLKNQDSSQNNGTSGNSSAPTTDPLQTQADIYSQMSAANAAAILKNVPVSQAKKILAKMSDDNQASILQKMDPVIASQILSQP